MSKTAVTVAIIGLNRQTASIGQALRVHSQQSDSRLDFQVRGQDGDKKALEAARHFGAVDETEANARSVVKNADIVFVDLPLSVHADVFEYMAPQLKPGAVVLDLSPHKGEVVKLAAAHFPVDGDGRPTAYLVGIYPMVNNTFLYSAARGVEAAEATLFEDSEIIIAPAANCPEEAVKLATDIAEVLDMRARYMLPDEFDSIADFTEGLPPILAMALFATMHQSSGSYDLRRAVNSDFALMLHSLRELDGPELIALWGHSPANSIRHIDNLMAILQDLRLLLQADDATERDAYLKDTLAAFFEWESRRERGRWAEDDEPSKNKNTSPSLFGGMFSFGRGGSRRDDEV